MSLLPLLLGVSAIASYAGSYSFSPASGNLTQSCINHVDILIDTEGVASNAADILILFNPSQIEIIDLDPTIPGVQIGEGNAYPSYFGNIVDNNLGEIRLTGADFANPIARNGVFASIGFRSLASTMSSSFEIYFTGSSPTNTLDSNIADAVSSLDILTQVTNSQFSFSPGNCISDSTPPTILFITPVNNQDGVSSESSILVQVTDAGSGVDVDSIELVLNGVVFDSSTFSFSVTEAGYLILLDSGFSVPQNITSSLLVRAYDLAGNYSESTIIFNGQNSQQIGSERADFISPTIEFIDPIDAGRYQYLDSIQFEVSDSGTGINISTLKLIIDGVSYPYDSNLLSFALENQVYHYSFNIEKALSEGFHSVSIFVQDRAGNGSLQSIAFEIYSTQEKPDFVCYDEESDEKVDFEKVCVASADNILISNIKESILSSNVDGIKSARNKAVLSVMLLTSVLGLLGYDTLIGLLNGFLNVFRSRGTSGKRLLYLFNSSTNEPIGNAIANLRSLENGVAKMLNSDTNGIIRFDPVGTRYSVAVNKSGYSAAKVVNSTIDERYNVLQNPAEDIDISDVGSGVIWLPMDQHIKPRINRAVDTVRVQIFKSLLILSILVVVTSFVFSTKIAFLSGLSLLEVLIFFVEICLLLMFIYWLRIVRPKYGYILDSSRRPLTDVLVTYKDGKGYIFAQQLTDKLGRYKLSNRSIYTVHAEYFDKSGISYKNEREISSLAFWRGKDIVISMQ